VKSIHANYLGKEKGRGEGARFEGLERGEDAAGSLYYRRGNCVVDASLGGVVWSVGLLSDSKRDLRFLFMSMRYCLLIYTCQ
jgi:hypothetical protein